MASTATVTMPTSADSDQAGKETHRPDCLCDRSRDQQRTEYDHRDAGDHSARSFSGLWSGAGLRLACSRCLSEPEGFRQRHPGELSEGGEVASMGYVASDYLAPICARNLDGANDILRL
jgi:hypothetical protein